jgi:hypothetical protein
MTFLSRRDLPPRPEAGLDLERLDMFRIYQSQFVVFASVIIIATRWHSDDLIGRLRCSAYLYESSGGGVECRAEGCGYWFCY